MFFENVSRGKMSGEKSKALMAISVIAPASDAKLNTLQSRAPLHRDIAMMI